ncbi:MAG TPA: tRNA (adenosine(37)-N6)-threonylcarbamoyltransferase complex dimerization subunit type 1 TsaB [Roseiflexaceae bacterium]|nr:tRNA (adenosine(37)-N6)-threonylcarbamoyltransferase complex dimerization subunit type 1 TsaB [Roseiflexaceae bacterium]HMP41025.1 tRNA (adenosine(37)-N6)-threonylcarbamoyltransferase complex dimerization subunit type 1 TsaB [Roseiflexaceae bacterium]
MLLAIDTATSLTGVALYDGSVLAEAVWHSGRDHTAQLLPQLTLLLAHLGRDRHDIAAVAVALGPGSWSGLRVGLSSAKGLALAHEIPLIGIGTLDALHYQYRGELPTVAIIRLGRDRFARIADDGSIANVAASELSVGISSATLFCGDLDAELCNFIREQLGALAHFPAPATAIRRPGFLAEMAWERYQRGAVDDAASLEPIYLGQAVRIQI